MNRTYSLALGVLTTVAAAASLAQPFSMESLWSLTPGSRTYLAATGDTTRGLGYDPLSDKLYVASRTAGKIYVLNGSTGDQLGELNMTGVSGGTFTINQVKVAGDGAIYGANLVTSASATSLVKVYRWADANAAPTVAYSGNPFTGARYGDDLDVRGSGTGTQILMGSNNASGANGTSVLVFTTGDGAAFTPTVLVPSGMNTGDTRLGIGFGPGDTFYGKQTAAALRLIAFDLTAGSAAVSDSYPTAVFPSAIGPLDVDASRNLLAGIDVLAGPDALRLYDAAGLSSVTLNTPLDSKAFGADNANVAVVGAVDFGGGRLYALDVNNGIAAFTVVPEPATWALLTGLGLAGFAGGRRYLAKRG